MTRNEKRIRLLAKKDPLVKQLLDIYDQGDTYSSFEDFLVDLVVLCSSVKEALHEHIESDKSVDTWSKEPVTQWGA